MTVQTFNPTDAAFKATDDETIFDKFQYSAAVRAGDFIYVAGQIGLNPDGSMPDDHAQQIRNAFDRMKLVLEAAGAGFEHIVELVSYHVNISENLGDFVQIKQDYIGEPYPTWTILEVAGLARPGLIIEIKATAYLPT
ncbi:RidA family protein [Epibacterium sp. Ofav1-8]|uniref:RidA family protein n=1 Tax=Epibacterium sp. Ofav1-8 TaxID=2917735 RepID=UPI001EF649FC|nr:RidA family protein [Epibacterium sp. Ofav1-8]MCG7625152.1 RidA family protein [Epibacterium sp. Ofav1-8]